MFYSKWCSYLRYVHAHNYCILLLPRRFCYLGCYHVFDEVSFWNWSNAGSLSHWLPSVGRLYFRRQGKSHLFSSRWAGILEAITLVLWHREYRIPDGHAISPLEWLYMKFATFGWLSQRRFVLVVVLTCLLWSLVECKLLEQNILARLALFGETLQYWLYFLFVVWVRLVEGGENVYGLLTNDGQNCSYLYWFCLLVKLCGECIIAPGKVKFLHHVSVVKLERQGGGNVNLVAIDDSVLSLRCHHVTSSSVDVYLIELFIKELNIN